MHLLVDGGESCDDKPPTEACKKIQKANQAKCLSQTKFFQCHLAQVRTLPQGLLGLLSLAAHVLCITLETQSLENESEVAQAAYIAVKPATPLLMTEQFDPVP